MNMEDNKEIWGYAASGGGAKGAWGGGVSDYLTNVEGREYDYLAGTSTGNLLMNLVALHKIDLLKKAYTTVTNDDIYELAPYTIKDSKNGVFKTKMNYFKIGWNIFVKKQHTFGDSTKLRTELIPKFFTEKDYNMAKKLNKELIACVTNLTLGRTEYKSNMDEGMTYEDFCDWVFASTGAAPIMSIVEKDNYEYADGGYIEHVPIQALIDKGCTHIDVLLHKSPQLDVEKIRDPLHLVTRLIDIMMWETSETDMELAKLKAKDHDITLNIYRPERKLTNNSLVFDQDEMEKWWEEGYKYAKEVKCETWVIAKRKKPKCVKRWEAVSKVDVMKEKRKNK